MGTPILICDDSTMARKQIARLLPTDWDVDIAYAKNGVECMEVLRSGDIDMVFLDLTMPEKDGYSVLKSIQEESIQTTVVVISADIQPEARERVMALGATDFIKKPVDQFKLEDVLTRYGLI